MESLDLSLYGGTIQKEYRLECATCAFWDSYDMDSSKKVESLARIQGWSETQKFGWICPECRTKDRASLAFWKPTLEIDMVTIDLKCECGERGEGCYVHKKGGTFGETVGAGMPRAWGFYIKEPERYIVAVCPNCKGTKGPLEIPHRVVFNEPLCKLPGG